ncbi:uncharacterized protein FIBRA_03996 [Fibroporia radiculosa]|uniref:glutathione transferase n=1 Tax=Fibroporia radiculosa TaxID=599839 RepID=J4G6P5_9APHY|nr:uncharacterized protein FIBRA_03996 [Fibroporia radiculosa]CCM01923.1 predicted protein [Fibroporia radiculosa]
MSHDKQFTLYTTTGGPNGWKVEFVLTELGLSYESIHLQPGQQKEPDYTKYNPNGRIPALVDHRNSDFVVWESDAILAYLVEIYDPTHRISAVTPEDKVHQLQWLFFQSSGQGPYFGQQFHFNRYHPVKLPTAIERYQKEIIRILGVLDSVLSKQEWLVAGKCTIADISFVPWNILALDPSLVDLGVNVETEFPAFYGWHQKLVSMESIKKVWAHRRAMLESQA